MRNRCLTFALAAVTCAAVAAHAAEKPAAPAADKPAAAPAAGQPSAEDMAKWQASMTPGPQHQHLAKMAGDWTYVNTMWMAPGAPPTKSEGTMHAEMTMGGRYLEEHWSGTMMGQPFEGHGIDAYDNVTGKYEGTWVDNMGTGIMTSTGTCDDASKSCTYTSTMSDPIAGKKSDARMVVSWIDDNSFKFEMFAAGPDGKEMKGMEIVAKRKM
jgi:Protein of unknown function (DUF1579)